MINEFYTALVNRQPPYDTFGADLADPAWRARKQTTDERVLRQCLLLNPEDSNAADWRSLEIRRSVLHGDFTDVLESLDHRYGRSLDDLAITMSYYLRPVINSTLVDSSRAIILGEYSRDAFKLTSWTITVDGTNWTMNVGTKITHGTRESVEHPIPLAETGAAARIPYSSGKFKITWAATPTTTLEETATLLTTSFFTSVLQVGNKPSVLPPNVSRRLVNVVNSYVEPPAKVAAAALLLIGSTLRNEPA